MRSESDIEVGIRPVCDVLNRMPGVTTVYSCEGHWLCKQPPYVMFDAPQEMAFRIHHLLENGSAGGKLKINWWLQARFQDGGGLRYILQTNDRRIREKAPWWTSWPLWFQMNKDLERLAGVLMHDEVMKQTLNRALEAIGDSQVHVHEKAGVTFCGEEQKTEDAFAKVGGIRIKRRVKEGAPRGHPSKRWDYE